MNDKTNISVAYVVGVFDTDDDAKKAYKSIKKLDNKDYHILSEARVSKGSYGKIKVHEKNDIRGCQGAAVGGLLGGMVGLVVGSLFWPVTVGAVVGGVAAKSRDVGFNDILLGEAADSLSEGTSALIAIVRTDWTQNIVDAMNTLGADVRYDYVPDELVTLYGDLDGGE